MVAVVLRRAILLCLLARGLGLAAEPEKKGLRGFFARKQEEAKARKQGKQSEGAKQAEVAEVPAKSRKQPKEAEHSLPHGVERPSKATVNKVKPMVRQVTDDVFKRATTLLHLPSIPAVFRWELVGKITQWAMKQYQKPKKVADLDLVNSVIELTSEVLSSEGASSLSDQQLSQRFLANTSRVEQMALHYAEQAHAPPAATKLINTAAQSMKEHKAADAQSTFKLLVDVANETVGPALADLLVYGQKVSKSEVKADSTKVIEMEAKLAARLGAPPAMEEYLRGTAEIIRTGAHPKESVEGARMSRSLAKAAEELHMPSGFSELFSYAAEVFGTADSTHVFDRQETRNTVVLRVNSLAAKICTQLAGPQALTQLIELSVAPLMNQTLEPAKVLTLVAKLMEELKLPKAVQESVNYLASTVGGARKPEREVELLAQLTTELGAPPAVGKFQESMAKELQKGSTPDNQKILKMVTQLLRKLEMPAVAGVMGTIVTPLVTKGTPPNALSLAAMAPNLMKILPEIESANSIFSGMRTKLLSPLMPVYENAVEKLTGGMPDSFSKSVFKKVLSVARPPIPSEEDI